MRHVLDTHAAVWNVLASARLGSAAAAALHDSPAAHLIISDVTLTEVARLLRRGTITTADPEAWLEAFASRYTVVPVSARMAWLAASYTFAHKDPCDRQILATAHALGLSLVTVDRELTKHAPAEGVRVVW
jgi:PIN domain nuclease of toxin-antitoxin system